MDDGRPVMMYQWWSLIPFAAMLACIALLPVLTRTAHWWESRRHQMFVSLLLGVPVTVWLLLVVGKEPLTATVIEYVQFIALLFALYVISGGIHLEGDIEATPGVNTVFLAVGGLLASAIGTTGAAMLVIRPLLATNRERTHRVHTVLFTIFVVANCGGLLTPLGDPPLFLGFLHGVPFTWTLGLWKEWAFVLVLLLLMYYSLDTVYHASETPTALRRDRTEVTPLRIRGGWNLVLLAVVVAAVAFVPSWDEETLLSGHAGLAQWIPWREVVMLGAAALSLWGTDRVVRWRENSFSWAPIVEVATLFVGIFATMAPALRFLEQVAPQLPLNRTTFFVLTGGLSSVLDNAPTYLTFFEMAKSLGPEGVPSAHATLVAGVPEYYLVAISLGAVMCGALTYIGNGPNFMVKSVAESEGVAMPSFGRYVVDAGILLLPVLAAMALVFVVPGLWASVAGWVIAAVLVGISVGRVWRTRGPLSVRGSRG